MMNDKTYYAVVDLEATGNQFNQENRIIQFGCTLIQNGQILETIDILINPERNIPSHIEKLTNITNQMVKKSPIFYDVAEYISSLLNETVFVAHNASFDFRLLNEEFERVSFPRLNNDVIDTVDLSRILLPRQASYTLSDLSESLELNLTDAHDAGDDSYATAELLLSLFNKAKKLPEITLETLKELTKVLNFQTFNFFDTILNQDDNKPISKDCVVVEGIALRKDVNETVFNYRQQRQFPYSTADKQRLYSGRYQSRPTQEKMMNIVYDTFQSHTDSRHIAIEAVAGSGKSMGYLLPLFYLASPDKQAIISTYTTILQHQLLEKNVADLRKLTNFDLPISLLKGRNHYIDLEQFHYLLNDGPRDKSRCIYLAKILVWLTETTTGDLDEIFTNTQRIPILSEVRTMKSNDMLASSKWAPYQFYLKALKQAEKSAIVITNHAFLVNDYRKETKQLPSANYVVIDESHHLPDIVQEASRKYFSTADFKRLIAHYQKKVSEDLSLFIKESENADLNHVYALIESNLTYLMFELPKWEQHIIDDLSNTNLKDPELISIYSEDILSRTKRYSQKWYNILDEMTQQAIQTIQILENQFTLLTRAERSLVDDWYEIVENLFEQSVTLKELIQYFNDNNNKIWVVMKKNTKEYHISFEVFDYEESEKFKQYMGDISYVLYTSGTLSVPQLDNLYEKQIDTQAITEYKLDSPYDYGKQIRVMVPKDLPSIKEMSVEAYNMWLADAIGLIAQQISKPILVLFNSLQSLEEVYKHLLSFPYLTNRLILAQNISGTKHRILKTFSRSKDAILLGADTFWEGIDLPGDSLEIIIMTRLPFESPEKPSVKSRQEKLKESGKNPFVYDALPRAQLKFKQGFGRLIRSTEDKGLLFVLDNRFIEANYAKNFHDILPDGAPIRQIDFNHLKNFDDYFTDD